MTIEDKALRIADEQFIPSIATMIEIRDDASNSPQTRFQVADRFVKMIVPEKIEVRKTDTQVDLNKLLDQLTGLGNVKTVEIEGK